MKMDKDKWIAVIFIASFAVIILALGFSGIDFSSTMIKFAQSAYNTVGSVGVYAAVFLISIFGNFTIFMPMPYIIPIASIIIVLPVNVLFISVFIGIGAAIGELTSWLLGRGASEFLNKRYEKQISGLKELINKGYAFWMILLFGLLPLPDDILFIALGMVRYSVKKAVIACSIGKVLMALSIGFFLLIAKSTEIGQLVLGLYGIRIENGVVSSSENPLMSAVSILVTVIIMFALLKVDWTKFIKQGSKS